MWPENNIFGEATMTPNEECSALREIYFADIGMPSGEFVWHFYKARSELFIDITERWVLAEIFAPPPSLCPAPPS